jgi:hypothetical protein
MTPMTPLGDSAANGRWAAAAGTFGPYRRALAARTVRIYPPVWDASSAWEVRRCFDYRQADSELGVHLAERAL